MKNTTEKRQGKTVLWLIDLIDMYLELNDLANDGNSFGWLAIKDKAMVQRLRDGGDITTTKMDDILAFMQSTGQHRTSTKEGLVIFKSLKPLNIKLKELP